MSSMIHGVRVLAKNDRMLTFKTYLIYSDWNSLPRTHGFGLLVLEDRARERENENCALAMEMKKYDFIDDNYAMGQKIVSRMEVTDFENFPLTEEFLEHTWHYIDENTGKFHAEEFLPQAVYTMEVTDAKWLGHINVGDVWETTSCDLDGASWYLEFKDDKSQKFYHIYDKMGGWKIVYGKIGTAGREETPWMNVNHAETKVKEKMRKGYELIYRNFDTPFGYEETTSRQAEVKAKEEAKPEGSDVLLKAVEALDVEAVKRILESGVDPNDCKDKYEHPVLESVADSWEITEKHLAIAQLLLDFGADPNVGCYGPFLPSVCYMGRSEEMLRLLIDRGGDILLTGGSDDHSVLQSASKNGMIWLVKAALEKGADTMHRSKQGHTALHYAAEAEQNAVETIDLLLAHGADLHDCNGEWSTPLSWAAGRGGKAETVRHLVKLGANADFQTPKGERAIHGAAQYGPAENLKALVELGADVSVPNSKGLPVMHIIAERLLSYSPEISEEAIEKIEFLLQKGFPLQPASPESTAAGQLLAKVKSAAKLKASDAKILFRLLELGYDPYEADPKDFSLIHFAAKINDPLLLAKCAEKPGNLNAQDEYGWTALHYAVCHKDKACVQVLMDSGSDEKLKTKRKRTFLKVNVPSGLTVKELKALF